jgi:hypothetical protein
MLGVGSGPLAAALSPAESFCKESITPREGRRQD